ncbi:hypothetical protein J18TS1_36180 [Oceanobacillus oncorhynchi subsp. incaldanensis]|uniref:hypothetical protein n=1 Tax=Oceanobacillus oncorhynchi TaxID=545501 RepID=UPI001B26E652|nr:hypothetical protein [Oceanobacillus oncorhynchi]GIO20518.1 hypothetical protein J18TS1_36180 [Oceanobacillus oncorhynchi subsp. incaldanensis]
MIDGLASFIEKKVTRYRLFSDFETGRRRYNGIKKKRNKNGRFSTYLKERTSFDLAALLARYLFI